MSCVQASQIPLRVAIVDLDLSALLEVQQSIGFFTYHIVCHTTAWLADERCGPMHCPAGAAYCLLQNTSDVRHWLEGDQYQKTAAHGSARHLKKICVPPPSKGAICRRLLSFLKFPF